MCGYCVGIELPPANSCQYQVFWNTSAGCPVALAWGVYFLIFFSVAAVGYFGGGYAYNSRQRGLSGSDAVPHFEFWVRQRPSAQQQLPACMLDRLLAFDPPGCLDSLDSLDSLRADFLDVA